MDNIGHAEQMLDEILKGEHIYPVYQPIVSLKNGAIYGYEALSRISVSSLNMNIEQLFRLADKQNKSWELEALCRARALENARHKEPSKKLFLNVNSNIIYDEKFQEGFTKNCLRDYGLDAENIIFEITERVSVLDSHAFLGSINHYKNQNYGIALDDVGAGYSGLNTIANVRPNILKLDMSLVRDIDKDETKQLLCKAMVDFSKNAGIQMIAEGIETEEELKTLIRLQVDMGQGYFLGVPLETFAEIKPEKVQIIEKLHEKVYFKKVQSSVYPIIGHLAKPGITFLPKERAELIYEALCLNPSITEFVLLEDRQAIGFMTKTA